MIYYVSPIFTENMRKTALRAAVVCLAASALIHGQSRKSHDWLTWGGDPERSGWNRSEVALSKTSVRNLELKWKAQIDKPAPIDIMSGAAMLTTPLLAEDVRTPRG